MRCTCTRARRTRSSTAPSRSGRRPARTRGGGSSTSPRGTAEPRGRARGGSGGDQPDRHAGERQRQQHQRDQDARVAVPAAVAGALVVGDALTWAPDGRLYRAVDGVTPVHFARGYTLLFGLMLLVAARGLGLRRVPHPAKVRAALRLGALVFGLAVAAELAAAAVRRLGGQSHVSAAVGTFLLLGALVALSVVFSPAPAPPPGTEAERRAVAALVQHPDTDSLAPFALRRDT